MINKLLDHFLQEVVDLVFSATEVSTLDKVVGLLSPSPSWVVQLEGPQEVGSILEVGSNSEDLVDQILNTDDSQLAQLILNDVVGGDGSSVSIDLDKSTFVDEITNSLQVGTPVGDVGLSLQVTRVKTQWPEWLVVGIAVTDLKSLKSQESPSGRNDPILKPRTLRERLSSSAAAQSRQRLP